MVSRVLKVTKPLMRGDDVKTVQTALAAKDFNCGTDGTGGIYRAATAYAVRKFQAMNGLVVSGRVDRFAAQKLGFVWKG